MSETTSPSAPSTDLIFTRIFDAPLERVWNAWSDSEQVLRWWGPTFFTAPLARIDFREGGKSLLCMRSPQGQDMFNTWIYEKITPMERIDFILSHTDKEGNKIDPAALGLPPDLPQDVRHVITFKSLGDNRTEMIVTEFGYTSATIMELSRMGMEQCLDKMAATFVDE